MQCALAKPEQRIAVCADALATGGLTPHEAAVAHYLRGLGESDQYQGDAALADYSDAVQLDADFWPVRWVRAVALHSHGNFDLAAADWTVFISHFPELAAPYRYRAITELDADRLTEALADFTKAISQASAQDDLAGFYRNRGWVYEAEGEWTKAIADLDEALRRDEHDSQAFRSRGRVKFLSGDVTGAIADLMKPAERGQIRNYSTLWLYLAELRAGKKEALDDLRDRASRIDTSLWPGPIMQVLLGTLPPDQVKPPHLPAAASEAAQKAAAQCELSFYLGETRLLQGDRAEAVKWLRAAVDSGATSYFEYRAARNELKRIAPELMPGFSDGSPVDGDF